MDARETDPSISDPLRNQALWKKMWKLNVPPKSLHFLCRIYNRTLLVRQKLMSRGVNLDPVYPRYGSGEETMEHALRDFEWDRMISRKSLLLLNLDDVFQQPIELWFLQ